MIIVVRLRGNMKINGEIRDTLDILGLKKVNSLVVLDDTSVTRGMLIKAESFITYGKVTEEQAKPYGRKMNLKPPRGGFRSVKQRYPKGDIGNRGEAIIEFVEKMLP